MHRVGIVGANLYGRIYAGAFRQQPGTEVVGMALARGDYEDDLPAQLGLTRFTNLEQMLAGAAPNVVCICSGTADHAKHAFDAPVHHGLGHNIRGRSLVFRFRLEPDKDLAVQDFHGVELLAGIFMSSRRSAGEWMKIPSVPGAADPALSVDACLNRSFAKRPALMRTLVVHGGPLAVEVREANRDIPWRDGFDPPVWEVVHMANLDPFQVRFAHTLMSSLMSYSATPYRNAAMCRRIVSRAPRSTYRSLIGWHDDSNTHRRDGMKVYDCLRC